MKPVTFLALIFACSLISLDCFIHSLSRPFGYTWTLNFIPLAIPSGLTRMSKHFKYFDQEKDLLILFKVKSPPSLISFLLIHIANRSPFSVATIWGDNDSLVILLKRIGSPNKVPLSKISSNRTWLSSQTTYTSPISVAAICEYDVNVLGSLIRILEPNLF